jgi:hypothetical protein
MLARFTVTQDDIDRGKISRDQRHGGYGMHCMVGQMLRRSFGEARLWVGAAFVSDGNTESPLPFFRLPIDVVYLIRDFDFGRPVYPFSFTCEIPDALAKYFDRRIEMKPQRAGALVTA